MSVPKSLRGLSDMEFYKNAVFIRNDLTQWMLRDFGLRKHPRNVRQTVKDMSEEDQAVVDLVFLKYNVKPKHEFESSAPQWFMDFERQKISEILFGMIIAIAKANSLAPYREFEWDMRRKWQDEAVTLCYALYMELQHIITQYPADLNRLAYILEAIDRETQLLKGWRQSDNARRRASAGK